MKRVWLGPVTLLNETSPGGFSKRFMPQRTKAGYLYCLESSLFTSLAQFEDLVLWKLAIILYSPDTTIQNMAVALKPGGFKDPKVYKSHTSNKIKKKDKYKWKTNLCIATDCNWTILLINTTHHVHFINFLRPGHFKSELDHSISGKSNHPNYYFDVEANNT